MARKNIVVHGFWTRSYIVGVLISVIAFVIMFLLNLIIAGINLVFSALTMQGVFIAWLLGIVTVFVIAPIVLGATATWVIEKIRK